MLRLKVGFGVRVGPRTITTAAAAVWSTSRLVKLGDVGVARRLEKTRAVWLQPTPSDAQRPPTRCGTMNVSKVNRFPSK